jgi:hypothetical protein
MAVVVSVGRNIGTEPMPLAEWQSFQDAVTNTLGSPVYFRGTGVGTYEGVTEESFTVITASPAWPTWRMRDLKEDLSDLAARYGQKAIAVTVGPTSFALPRLREAAA